MQPVAPAFAPFAVILAPGDAIVQNPTPCLQNSADFYFFCLTFNFQIIQTLPQAGVLLKNQTNKQHQQQKNKKIYMRDKKFIRTLTCVCVVLMACGTAFAQGEGKLKSGPYQGKITPAAAPDAVNALAYTNLATNPCTGCNYSADNGYLILGPNNCGIPGATQWLAFPFIPRVSTPVRRVFLSITDWGICVPTSFGFTVAIYSDNCTNTPGTQIGQSRAVTAPAAPCALASANFNGAGVSVTAGQQYWLVVTTDATATQNGTTAVWWMSNIAQAPYNLNDGNGWVAFPDGAPGGFQIQ